MDHQKLDVKKIEWCKNNINKTKIKSKIKNIEKK